MPECQGCGSHVTKRWVRVMASDPELGPQSCPDCETFNEIVEGGV